MKAEIALGFLAIILIGLLVVQRLHEDLDQFCKDEGFERYDKFQESCLKNNPIRRLRDPHCSFELTNGYNCAFPYSRYDYPSDKEYCDQLSWNDKNCQHWKEEKQEQT